MQRSPGPLVLRVDVGLGLQEKVHAFKHAFLAGQVQGRDLQLVLRLQLGAELEQQFHAFYVVVHCSHVQSSFLLVGESHHLSSVLQEHLHRGRVSNISCVV